MDEPMEQRASRPAGLPGRRVRVVARVLVTLVALHLLATALYVVDRGPSPFGVRTVARQAMEPMFRQNWSVFAPDPVSYSTALQVRSRTTQGTLTPWFDVSACDVRSAVLHHPVPGRRYLTTFQLVKHFRGDHGPADVTAMNGLAGQIARARWGDVAQVQVRIDDTHFVPFAERDDPAAAPTHDVHVYPWQSPGPASNAAVAATRRLYGPRSGCDGSSG